MAHLTITASCESCNHSYRSETPEEKRSAVKAARSNADVWAQTHRNLVGHPRFQFTETVSHYRIFGQDPHQFDISEDPRYGLLGDAVEHAPGR